MKSVSPKIPEHILNVAKTIADAGFEAYFVGGSVRDLLLEKTPKDWDITTNATPEKIIAIFPHTFYENEYGTVGVVIDEKENTIVEVTPYRLESGYSDKRRPDEVRFSENIEDDLKRRDFTINAMAYEPFKGSIIDFFKGQEDLKDKVIRTVGDPTERFTEDALRLLRAVRLACELEFVIDPATERAIIENAELLNHISKERIRNEFTRIVMSDNPKKGIELSNKVGVLRFIIPDLEKGIGIDQGGAHSYDVWEHLLRSLQHAADKKWPLEIRLAALLHDIGKPATRKKIAGKEKWTFYSHEIVGTKMAKKILLDLKFPQKTIDKVTKLIRWHMFFSDTETITHSAVRRLVASVGKDNVWDLINLRVSDRIGTGRPKENPYRLRKYQAMIEEVMSDPISVGMLKIDGKRLMEVTNSKPGPKIGFILHALLEEIIENPALNTIEHLEKRASELIKLPEKELKKLGESGKEAKSQEAEKKVGEIRKKYFVE